MDRIDSAMLGIICTLQIACFINTLDDCNRAFTKDDCNRAFTKGVNKLKLVSGRNCNITNIGYMIAG